MNAIALCRTLGGAIVLLIGLALAVGGVQLLRGGAAAWPDLVANDATVRRTATGMLATAILLAIAGVATIGHRPWGGWAAAMMVLGVVVAAFWVNHLLFGDIRPQHTVTNLLVAAAVLGLLWFGYSAE